MSPLVDYYCYSIFRLTLIILSEILTTFTPGPAIGTTYRRSSASGISISKTSPTSSPRAPRGNTRYHTLHHHRRAPSQGVSSPSGASSSGGASSSAETPLGVDIDCSSTLPHSMKHSIRTDSLQPQVCLLILLTYFVLF